MATNTKYKQLQAPTQHQLYTEPRTEPPTNKRIHLQTDKGAFIFFICNTRPDLIFLEYKNKTRINTLLKQYTQEEDTQQLIKLL